LFSFGSSLELTDLEYKTGVKKLGLASNKKMMKKQGIASSKKGNINS